MSPVPILISDLRLLILPVGPRLLAPLARRQHAPPPPPLPHAAIDLIARHAVRDKDKDGAELALDVAVTGLVVEEDHVLERGHVAAAGRRVLAQGSLDALEVLDFGARVHLRVGEEVEGAEGVWLEGCVEVGGSGGLLIIRRGG